MIKFATLLLNNKQKHSLRKFCVNIKSEQKHMKTEEQDFFFFKWILMAQEKLLVSRAPFEDSQSWGKTNRSTALLGKGYPS